MTKRMLASVAAAVLVAGSLTFAAAPAAAACEYPWYCETVRYDTPVYASADNSDQIFYYAHAGDSVEVNINSCSHNRIWGADNDQGRTTGWFPNEALSFSPCYLMK